MNIKEEIQNLAREANDLDHFFNALAEELINGKDIESIERDAKWLYYFGRKFVALVEEFSFDLNDHFESRKHLKK